MQAEQVRSSRTQSPEISTHIYTDEVPEFVQHELPLVHGHIRSSLPYLDIFKPTEKVNTYVARQGESPTAIVLFSISGRNIVVLNEMIRMRESDLHHFATAIFHHIPASSMIRFEAINVAMEHFPYPVQHGPSEENVMITLPATPEEYVASLGKNTRPRIRQQLTKLKRDFPSFSFQTYEKEEIDEQLFYRLIDLKGDTIKTRKRRFSIEEARAGKLWALAKRCGVVHVIWIDGQIGAAKIDFRLGLDQVGEVTYHDSLYNSYSLGMICNFLDIQDSIAKGVRRFHLGPGQNPYKLQLLGVPEQFGQLNVYRSSAHMMRHWDRATTMWARTQAAHLRGWLNSHENSPITRSLLVLLRSRQALREAWARSRTRM